MFLSHDDETIIAQCTPMGSGAIAMLRMSGVNSLAIASAIAALASKKRIIEVESHTIHYGSVHDTNGTSIDNVLFFVMKAPRTFTGQDVVEISCHNNQFIIEEIINAALMAGARLAKEGEFSKRAVLNNKIDLVQAEAINELIGAQTQQARKRALAQVDGSFSHWITIIEKQLLKAMAFCEASFEFIDEELEFSDHIKVMVSDLLSLIQKTQKTFDHQQQIRSGIKIALVGSVNAGKSSLFNALLGAERAIVTPIAGTTRDSIEATVSRDGNFWTLIDTAGLRTTDDIVEQEGIKRSLQQAALSDVVLLVYDVSRILSEHEAAAYDQIIAEHGNKIIIVNNKVDQALNESPKSGVAVSAYQKIGIDLLENRIQEKISSLFAENDSPFLLNTRQSNLLMSLEKKLQDIVLMLDDPQYELLSIQFNDALAHLSELTGKTVSEQTMDAVFNEFCVGK
jgi:tRNA modification GTPase